MEFNNDTGRLVTIRQSRVARNSLAIIGWRKRAIKTKIREQTLLAVGNVWECSLRKKEA